MSIGTSTLVENVHNLDRGRVIGNHVHGQSARMAVVILCEEIGLYRAYWEDDLVVITSPRHTLDININHLTADEFASYVRFGHSE